MYLIAIDQFWEWNVRFYYFKTPYYFSFSDGKMTLLVLNTMYWNNNWYTDPLVDEIAENQFVWFENQLQLAKDEGKKVLIMSHIPPG